MATLTENRKFYYNGLPSDVEIDTASHELARVRSGIIAEAEEMPLSEFYIASLDQAIMYAGRDYDSGVLQDIKLDQRYKLMFGVTPELFVEANADVVELGNSETLKTIETLYQCCTVPLRGSHDYMAMQNINNALDGKENYGVTLGSLRLLENISNTHSLGEVAFTARIRMHEILMLRGADALDYKDPRGRLSDDDPALQWAVEIHGYQSSTYKTIFSIFDYDQIGDDDQVGHIYNQIRALQRQDNELPGQDIVGIDDSLNGVHSVLEHGSLSRAVVAWMLGSVDIESFPPASVDKIMLILARDSDCSQLNRIKSALDKAGDYRDTFMDTFLSMEHGEDFGGVIIDIVELASTEQSKKVFGAIASMRRRAKEEGQSYGDSILAIQVERAMNERITELMYVARDLLQNGQISCEQFGRIVKVESIDELVDDYITVLDNSLKRSHVLLQAGVATRVTEPNQQYDLFRFSDSQSEDDMLLYVKEVGSRSVNNQVQYGSSAGAEASISKIINPYGGHTGALKRDREQELSIRLDREGRAPDMPRTASSDADPTVVQGTISLDIGSVLGSQNSFGTKIALIIAHGNSLRAEKLGTASSLNHNTSPFDQQAYGSAEGFAELAKGVSRMARVRLSVPRVGRLLRHRVSGLKVAA